MKMTVLLLVSALSLLVIPAVPSPHHKVMMKRHEGKTMSNLNLNRIIDLAEKHNASLTKEFFVDDVSPLVDAGCEHTFFCKVHDILQNRRKHFEDIVRNLEAFFNHRDVNCTVLLKNVTSKGVSIQLPALMKDLIDCIRQTNIKGSNA